MTLFDSTLSITALRFGNRKAKEEKGTTFNIQITQILKGISMLPVSDASSYTAGQTFYVDGGALSGWTEL